MIGMGYLSCIRFIFVRFYLFFSKAYQYSMKSKNAIIFPRMVGMNITLVLLYFSLTLIIQDTFGIFFWVTFFPMMTIANVVLLFSLEIDYRLVIFLSILMFIIWLLMLYLYPLHENMPHQIFRYQTIYQIDLYATGTIFLVSIMRVLLVYVIYNRTFSVKEVLFNFRLFSTLLCLTLGVLNLFWIVYLSIIDDIQSIRIFLPIGLGILVYISLEAPFLFIIFMIKKDGAMGLKP